MRSDLDRANLRRVALISAAGVILLQGVTARRALRDTRRDYADAIWGPGLALIAAVGALAGNGDPQRRYALAAMTGAWAARLERQMATRISGNEEDPRYSEFLEDAGPVEVIAKVFLTQGLAQLIVSAPLQLAAASRLSRGPRRRLAPLGLALMAAGAAVEAVADRQKDRYSARPRDERPDVLDTGLWGISRHPNYFGDSLVWDGAWLASAASAPALVSLPAPALMSYLLMYATGAKRTEKRMADRPGYRDYQDRVAFFVPWVKRLR